MVCPHCRPATWRNRLPHVLHGRYAFSIPEERTVPGLDIKNEKIDEIALPHTS